MFEVGTYFDQDTGRNRFAVLECNSRTWYFAKRYGKRAVIAYCAKLNKMVAR